MRLSIILPVLCGLAVAIPMDHRLEDIQCRCLSFSTDAKPSFCTHMESHAFDFHTATSLASDYDLKLQFASQSTITKVLSIRRPLPSSVLQRVSQGEVMPVDSKNLLQREQKIVCGFGDEVKHMGNEDGSSEVECHFVGYILAGLTLFVLLYVVAEHVWSRFIRQGSIKLEGDEKALMAEYEASTATQDDPKEATFTEIP